MYSVFPDGKRSFFYKRHLGMKLNIPVTGILFSSTLTNDDN